MTSSTRATPTAVAFRPSPEEIGAFRERIHRLCGLYVGEEHDDRLSRVLEIRSGSTTGGDAPLYIERFESAGFQERTSVLDLLYHPTGALSLDDSALNALRRSFAPRLFERARERGDAALRLWCIARDRGWQAYTLALNLCLPLEPDGTSYPVEIVLTVPDLPPVPPDPEGSFIREELAGLTPEQRRGWFEERGARWKVRAEAFDVVRYVPMPVKQLVSPREGAFDIISARGIFPYLDTAQRPKLLAALERSLYPGGVLFLGRGEASVTSGSPLRLVLYPGGAAHRKPLRA